MPAPTIYDFDGYEDYATAGILREHVRIAAYPGAGPPDISVVAGGRNGGKRLKFIDTAGICGSRAIRALPSITTVAWGAYMETTALSVFVFDVRSVAGSHLLVKLNADGSVSVYRSGNNLDWGAYYDSSASIGSGAVLLGSSAAGLVHVNVPFHFQAKATIHDSTGAVEIRINSVAVLTLTNQDTRNGAPTNVTNLLHGAASKVSATTTVYYDDIWVADDFIGDRRVDSHKPIEDGANQDGTPSSAGDHFAMVDEMPEPDDDTSYVTLAAASDRESYGMEDFKNSGSAIDAVMIVLDAKKVTSGAATIGALMRQGVTNYDGPGVGLATDYTRIKVVSPIDPATGVAWTESGLNAAEFGELKVT